MVFFLGSISWVGSCSWVEAVEISCSCPGFPVFQVFGEHLYSDLTTNRMTYRGHKLLILVPGLDEFMSGFGSLVREDESGIRGADIVLGTKSDQILTN